LLARRGALAELRYAAIDGDPPGFDPGLDFPARAEARGR
jgi:hypothetical protein